MKKLLIGVAAIVTLAAACTPPVAIISKDADSGNRTGYYYYELKAVPHDSSADGGSNPTGRVVMEQDGNRVHVKILAAGLAEELPHAQHIHGVIGGSNVCPTIEDDADDNGLIDTPEGVPSYGGIKLSLTTTGDSSPDSALAVPRFPVADDGSILIYDRVLTVSDEVAANLEDLHIVIHGIDLNNNGSYDFDAGPSPLDEELPLEATIPALCGGLSG